jgi:hypothetical protein
MLGTYAYTADSRRHPGYLSRQIHSSTCQQPRVAGDRAPVVGSSTASGGDSSPQPYNFHNLDCRTILLVEAPYAPTSPCPLTTPSSRCPCYPFHNTCSPAPPPTSGHRKYAFPCSHRCRRSHTTLGALQTPCQPASIAMVLVEIYFYCDILKYIRFRCLCIASFYCFLFCFIVASNGL